MQRLYSINTMMKDSIGHKEKRSKLVFLLKDIQQTRQKIEAIIERENIWTIPNIICIRRILSTPCLEYLIVNFHFNTN